MQSSIIKIKFSIFIPVIVMIFLILFNPEICCKGAEKGIFLCGSVIIPSLFPFTVFVLMIMRSGMLQNLKISWLTEKIFKQSPEMFIVMLFSMIGGYPIGGKMINELFSENKINKKDAMIMKCYCVNAGPAFILIAVGNGILHSKELGIILLVSHISASLIIAFFCGFFLESKTYAEKSIKKNISFSDLFVNCVSDAAQTSINICSYVILFSTVNEYIINASQKITAIKALIYISEVTTAVSNTKNIILISFLLGMAGISVWCQVYSSSRKTGMNWIIFIAGRISHGLLSALICFGLIKIFKITVPAISNNINFETASTISGGALALSLIVLGITWIFSLENKKRSGNLLEDLV